jgi:biopolymer transport protein ExbD
VSTKLRLAALIALTLITAGYAYYLFMPNRQVEAPAPAPDTFIQAEVLADGSVVMQGERFSLSDPAKLKAKVAAIQKEHPNVGFNLHAAREMKFEPVGKAALLFQRSGAANVAFITEPKNEPEK